MTITTHRVLAVQPAETHNWHVIEGSQYDRNNIELTKRIDDLNVGDASIISWLTFHAPEILSEAIAAWEACAALEATA